MHRPTFARITAVLAALSTVSLPAVPLSAQDLEIGGQLRPRFETIDPLFTGVASDDPLVEGRSESFTSMRTRLTVRSMWEGWISALVQIQDVRRFGEETSTLGDFDADGLDMHQAWVQLGAHDATLQIRAGRQEVAFGEERLVGAVDWTQQARSFDGAVGTVQHGPVAVDLFAFQTREIVSRDEDDEAAFLGGYGTLDLGAERELDLYLLWRSDPLGDVDTEEGTVGGRYAATEGPVHYRLEGAYQFGERAEVDVDAHLIGASVGVDVLDDRGTVTLWYDRISGNDGDGDDQKAFNTLFATNHGFYGIADLFLDIPRDTNGGGLEDFAVKTKWRPVEPWTLSVDAHRFELAEDALFTDSHLADEIDITVGRTLAEGVVLSGGAAFVFEGDALLEARGIGEDVSYGYLMLDVVF